MSKKILNANSYQNDNINMILRYGNEVDSSLLQNGVVTLPTRLQGHSKYIAYSTAYGWIFDVCLKSN